MHSIQDMDGHSCKLPEEQLRKTFRMRPRRKAVEIDGSGANTVEAQLLVFQKAVATGDVNLPGEASQNPENGEAADDEMCDSFNQGARDSLADLRQFQKVYSNLQSMPARQTSVAPTPRAKKRAQRKALGMEARFAPSYPDHPPHRTTRRNRAAAGRRSYCDPPSADLPSHSGRAPHGSAIGYGRASRHDATDCTV